MTRAGSGAADDRERARTWPFWAPSERASVDAALALAEVGPGVHVVDLGCGDGQVLLAAAELGARVSGIEADEALAEEARGHLSDAGVDGDIVCGDLFDPATDLDADVYFTYLAPATLQRLWPRLRERTGAKVVTVDFAVPDLIATRRDGSARLYRMPGRRRPIAPPGWAAAGTLVAAVPDVQSLTCLEVVHPGGRSDVRLAGAIAEAASVLGGTDRCDGPRNLAIDLRWEGSAAGTVVVGDIRVRGLEAHTLVVAVTDDEDGMWDLTDEAVVSIRRSLRSSTPPTSVAELLDVAES